MERVRCFFVPVSFVSVWLIGVRENNSYVNLNVKGGKVAVGGNGDSLISFTTRPDAARFLAYVLVHAPKARLQNQTLRLEGDRAVCISYIYICFYK